MLGGISDPQGSLEDIDAIVYRFTVSEKKRYA